MSRAIGPWSHSAARVLGAECLMRPALVRLLCGALLALAAVPAQASLFSGETVDAIADVLTVIVIIVVPIVAVVVFWLVHILPEKFAHKRHHPQKDAIQVLCLLSLVFGGLLWPLAWLWAFTKPIGYRLAYGTDKHDEYFDQLADQHRSGALVHEEVARLREELEAIEAKGALPPRLKLLKDELSRPRIAEAAAREEQPSAAQAEPRPQAQAKPEKAA